jgi:hypothetical protein
MAMRGDPLLVSLIGHSFIRRLRDFMADNLDSANPNLGLYCDQCEVSCVARGGLTVSKLLVSSVYTFLQMSGYSVHTNREGGGAT